MEISIEDGKVEDEITCMEEDLGIKVAELKCLVMWLVIFHSHTFHSHINLDAKCASS